MSVIARAHRARRRAGPQPRRVRRSEPVHRARGRGRDPTRAASARSARALAARTAVCVIGLGHVGSRVAKRCARAGATLVRRRCRRAQAGAGRAARRALDSIPARALEADVDVLAPCALGGVLDDETVPRLRCRIDRRAPPTISSPTTRVADLLAARGILWAPDFVVNAGGLINIAEELGGYDPRSCPPARARDRRHAARDLRRRRGDRRDAADGGDGAGPAATGLGPGRALDRPAPARSQRLGRGCTPRRWASRPAARPRPAAAPRRRACRGARPASPPPRAAASRGTSSQTSSSSSSDAAQAVIERRQQPPLTVEPVRDVLLELGARVVDQRSVARADHREPRARAAARGRPGSRPARRDRGR